MSNTQAYLEMSAMFEKLRLQLRFRELKTKLGDDQALGVIEDALRLEFHSDLETTRPVPEKIGNKNSPVVLQ